VLRQYISNTVVQWLLVDGEVEDFKPQKVIIMMCSALYGWGAHLTSPLQTSNCKTDKRYIVPALLLPVVRQTHLVSPASLLDILSGSLPTTYVHCQSSLPMITS
jgi:hypothetical protein